MELRHPAKNYYFGISTGYVIKQLVHAFSCMYVHRVMDALGKFGEHSRSWSCSRLRLEQLLRFSRALQTSRVHP